MRIENEKKNMQRMQATIAASWATYRRMRKEGVISDVPLKLTPMRKEDQLVKYGDENGLIFAPTCHPSNDGIEKCFDSCRNKLCSHKTDNVPLNHVGQYVIFPSRWWHRGYYEIRSEKMYYTAQLFCVAAQDPESWCNQTRKQNRNMKIGRIPKCRCMMYLGTLHKFGTRHTRRLSFHLQRHSTGRLIEAQTDI